MIARCDACHGRKQLTGLGGMMKTCKVCSGIGYTKEPAAVKPAGRRKKDVKEG